MLKEAPRIGELPQSMRILLVDDEPDALAKNIAALLQSLSTDVDQLEISAGSDISNLIDTALSHQPEIVVLDNHYKQDYQLWKPTEEQLEMLAQKYGVNFAAIKKPDRGGWSIGGAMPDSLYIPNSTNFALLLRYFGFGGKIIVSSGDPPSDKHIERKRVALNDHLAKFSAGQVNQPIINGVIVKGFRNDHQLWATRPGKNDWDYHWEEMTYPQALNKLIREI